MRPFPPSPYPASAQSSRIDTMDSLSDKQIAKSLALTIGILVVVMLAFILAANIV